MWAVKSGLRWRWWAANCLPCCWQKYLVQLSSQDKDVPDSGFLIVLLCFWEEGVISFTYAGGWVWLRTTAIGILEKLQITKTVILFLDWFPYWGLGSHRLPFSLTFTALCLCSVMTELVFFLLSFICHWETRNDQFHFICWDPKAENLLDTGACGEA